jgi:hypothetical protein
MTEDGGMRHDTRRDRNAYERLRTELLISGLLPGSARPPKVGYAAARHIAG